MNRQDKYHQEDDEKSRQKQTGRVVTSSLLLPSDEPKEYTETLPPAVSRLGWAVGLRRRRHVPEERVNGLTPTATTSTAVVQLQCLLSRESGNLLVLLVGC